MSDVHFSSVGLQHHARFGTGAGVERAPVSRQMFRHSTMLSSLWLVAGTALVAGVVAPGRAAAGNFSCSYVGAGGAYTTPGDWASCNGTFPDNSGGNTYDATIGNGATVSLTTPNTAGALTIGSGVLAITGGNLATFTASASNAGTVYLDASYSQGGSSLAAGGMLTNSNFVDIGNTGLAANTTVTAAGLNNTGTITLNGAGTNLASLVVNAAAPSVSTGTVNLGGNAVLQYSGGGITSIGSGAQINESGAAARVALASAPTTNSALSGLASNAGQLQLSNGSTLTTTTGLNNTGTVYLDIGYSQGGSSLAVGGTLTNSNYVDIGNTGLSANTTVTVAGLNNTGTITLNGNGTNLASLVVNAAAPSVSTGTVNLGGNAVLQYSGGGITSIGSGAQINESGAAARVGLASAPATNSALSRLASNAGQLQLSNGSTLTTTTGLNNTGTVYLDTSYSQGGSSLAVGGTLTNSNYVDIGNTGLSANTTVTAAGLNNTGTITLNGAGTNLASLVVNAAAPSVSTGTVNLGGNAVLQYSGGGITSIGSGAQINESGAAARVGLASAPATNSALSRLASNAGQLQLSNGSTLTTTTGLNNTGTVYLDTSYSQGGSSLAVGGTLTNSNYVDIGNTGLSANTTVTAAGLNNTGTITLNGAGTNLASLVVNAAAPSVSTGTVNLGGNAVLQYSGGGITSIGNGAQINESGATARVALASAPATNSALSGLASNAGQLQLSNGSTLTTTTGLNNTGTVYLDTSYSQGGSSLAVGGTLTNSNYVDIGNTGLSANTTVTAAGLNNTGTITLNGNGTNLASLVVNAAAPSVSTGTVNLGGNAVLQYSGGGITSIGSRAQINESGVAARVALASAPTTNSALSGLASNAGQLQLSNGSTLTTTTGLNNTGTVYLDTSYSQGGSSLAVGGTLTNSNYVDIGNTGLSANTTVTAAGLNNTGTITLNGAGTNLASLVVNGAAGNSGAANIGVGGAITVAGAPYTQTGVGSSTIVLGTLTAPNVNVNGGLLQGNGTVAGTLNVGSGGQVAGSGGNLNAPDTLKVSGGYTSTGTGTLVAPIETNNSVGQAGSLKVGGSVTLNGGTVQTLFGQAPVAGQSFTLVSFAPGAVNGLYSALQNTSSGALSTHPTYLDYGGGLTLGLVYNDHAGTIQLQVVNTPTVTATSWTGGTGSYGTPGQWTTGAVPIFFNDVTIGATGSGAVTLNQDSTINSLAITSGNTLQYQATTPQTLTVGQGVGVQAGGSLTLGAGGDKLALGGAFTNAGSVSVGSGATVNGQGAASNSNQLSIQGGILMASSVANSGLAGGYGAITATGGTQVANTGLVQAQGGTLVVATGLAGTGNAAALANSTLDLSGAKTGNTVGTLTLSGANAGLNLGAQSITVGGDYANANTGVGNAFNNHANVAGTGQILAAGNVGMRVSGAGITGGTTATPSLALGNVHVGSTQATSFTVDNTGSTGPAIRGAVQTGGITGGGLVVTAQNFGPVALGGSSAAQSVSYGPAAAGALVGQSFKVVSNFDNVAAQTVGVTGAAYDYANPVINTVPPIAFGNVHVGAAVAQQGVSISNATVSNAAFQEGLNASVTGATGGVTSNGGAITLLAAGQTDTGTIKLGLDTSSAGAKSGTATIGLVSDGAGTSGLGQTALASQSVQVTGSVYRLAQANAIAGLAFGNVHQNTAASQALSVSNVAANDGFSEKLSASFGGTSDARIQTSGTVSLLGAGSTNSTGLVVSLNTSQAGSINGTATVHLQSDGTGTSGLGLTALADQTPGVTATITSQGSVYGLAQASAAAPNPVNFGNARINTALSQTLSIQNTAPNDGFHEKLDAQIGSATGAATTNGGSFTLLAPQSTDSTSLAVGLNTSVAGARSGQATIALQSDGQGTSGLGITPLPSQSVTVQGNVYRIASPTLNSSTVSLAARVGAASPVAAVSVTNASADAFTEGLKASLGAAPAGFTSSGAIGNLVAGGTDASSLKIGLNTAVSGTFSGATPVTFTSMGVGTDNAVDLALTAGSVAVSGKVYQTAVASVSPGGLSFGIVHVGDSPAAQAILVGNTASGALTDVVTGSIGSVSGPFSNAGAGSLGAGVAAGGSSGALQVGLNTGASGVFSGSASLALASHDADLADVALATTAVTLSGQVNNYASGGFGKISGAGAFGGGGLNYTLDFGTITQGSSAAASLFADNTARAVADLLSGSFQVVSGSGFGLSGFGPFSGLAAGQQFGGLGVSFADATVGGFSETLELLGVGSNASGYSGSVAPVFLTLDGVVASGGGTNVPEPWSIGMLASALALLTGARRGARRRFAGR